MGVLLRVEKLETHFKTERGVVKAVDGVSYEINEGEIVGLVGESGCGKSVSQLSVLRLIPSPPGDIVGGKVIFEGKDLLGLKANGPEMRAIRGRRIAIVFQEPMTSLNPALTVGFQLREMLELHLGLDARASRQRSVELLRMVGVPDAERRIDDFPHQFSGGMRQRVMVAMAISCNPRMIIADEATTALDATTQLQLLELIREMVTRLNMALVIVTHNLGVVARYAQRVYVMYAGRIVEHGSVNQLLLSPRHPYTIGLLQCVPRPGDRNSNPLIPIGGTPPSLINMPPTCAFLPRCRHKVKMCHAAPWPDLKPVDDGHYAACYLDVRSEQSAASGTGLR